MLKKDLPGGGLSGGGGARRAHHAHRFQHRRNSPPVRQHYDESHQNANYIQQHPQRVNATSSSIRDSPPSPTSDFPMQLTSYSRERERSSTWRPPPSSADFVSNDRQSGVNPSTSRNGRSAAISAQGNAQVRTRTSSKDDNHSESNSPPPPPVAQTTNVNLLPIPVAAINPELANQFYLAMYKAAQENHFASLRNQLAAQVIVYSRGCWNYEALDFIILSAAYSLDKVLPFFCPP